LAEAGYRVIVPYLRGFGTTRFLSDETFRNGEQAVLAVDVIALMDALELAGAISQGGAPPVLVVASDHLVSYEERVCDTLSAGGAAAFVVGVKTGSGSRDPSPRPGGSRTPEIVPVSRYDARPSPAR